MKMIRKILARLMAHIMPPVGYEDETGFHKGFKPSH
jgi:hypothetical protein